MFSQFAMATLCDYTDLPRETDPVISVGELEGDVIKVATRYQLDKPLRIRIGNSSTFPLGKEEPIELIVCRKYTEKALASMLQSFDQVAIHKAPLSRGFGSNMYLLSAQQPQSGASLDPVAATPKVDN